MSGLNPKVFLLFVALLPQFTDANTGLPVPAQLLALVCVHLASSAVVYTAVAAAPRCSSSRFRMSMSTPTPDADAEPLPRAAEPMWT